MKYAFMKAHQAEFSVRAMCRMLRVHFSGFYAWLKEPLRRRARDDARQTDLIRHAWTESGRIYGYRKLADDLRDFGEQVSENRVARLAGLAGIAAQVGYKRRPGRYGGKPAVVASNTLDRQFEVDAPDKIWVTDITYIRTHEGWLYLAVVIDLFSRRVVGWSAQPRMTTDLAAQTKDQSDDPLRPGIAVHKPRVAGVPCSAQSGAQHEPPRELPRQCRRGKLLPALEAGTYPPPHLPHPRRRKAGRFRLHRDVLQPETQAHEQRHAVPR